MVIQAADVNLDSIVGLAAAQATPVTNEVGSALARAGTDPAQPILLNCRDQLSPDLQERVKAQAAAILPIVLKDPNQLSSVGLPALDEINSISNRLFHVFLGEDRVKIPELNQYTKELGRAVRGFNAKNDRNTQRRRNIAQYDKSKQWLADFLNKNIDWLRELIDDAKSMERRMNSIQAQIIDKMVQLARNVKLCNELLEVNETAIVKLVLATAMMEYLHDGAVEAHDAIVIDKSDPHARERSFEKEQVRTLVEQLEVRLSEFKQRLFVAGATSPQVLNIRTLNYSLGQRLGMIVTLTIPVFKLTVAQWAMQI